MKINSVKLLSEYEKAYYFATLYYEMLEATEDLFMVGDETELTRYSKEIFILNMVKEIEQHDPYKDEEILKNLEWHLDLLEDYKNTIGSVEENTGVSVDELIDKVEYLKSLYFGKEIKQHGKLPCCEENA